MRKPDLMANKDKMNNIKSKLRKGLWSPDEDERLVRYSMLGSRYETCASISRALNASIQPR